MLSWIQYHILLELTRYATRRYSELRPQDVEGNLFMYHLKGLIKDGLVEKHEKRYRLSVEGLRFAGTLSLETGKTRQQPKILSAIICKNDKEEYLFSRWHRQPNVDLVSFPHGMMHFGKKLHDMVARELAEKAGLEAKLTYRGEVYVRGFRAEALDRHMLVHLFEATAPAAGREAELRPQISQPFWARLEDIRSEEFVPGFYEIAQLANRFSVSAETIFEDVDVTIPDL
jgi:ADP-ribose pyrophosphatase YjhB (NUDIX family)